MELDDLRRRQLELQCEVSRIDRQIASCKDTNERLRLMNLSKSPKRQLSEVGDRIARIEIAEQLKVQQEKRDALANRQNNSSGKTRNRQRDIY